MKKIVVLLLLPLLGGCSALQPDPPMGESGDGDVAGDGDGDASGDGDGDGDGDNGKDPDETGQLPDGTDSSAALPARIRRLTNAEYDASVRALLGTTQTLAVDFPPDARQHGYTLNEAQRVDPVLARKLDAAATALATEAVQSIDSLAPCGNPAAEGTGCAMTFVDEFASRAYRRPLTNEERDGLMALYQAGATDGNYSEGIHLVIRGVLQSPGFLYLTEIGDGSQEGTISMTHFEVASSLSYLLTGGPPDDELLAAAEAGMLRNSDERMAQAARLLNLDAGKNKAVRIVRQWLGIDRIASTAKDSNIYPQYDALRDDMAAESVEFPLATLESSGGSLEELLGAKWTVASAELASAYGASGQGRVDVPNRPGLLNQGAFLSVYAHAHESGPVLRGTTVLRKIGCREVELPATLDLEIVPPVPDPNLTTRERFAVHSDDPACRNCHRAIDEIGFSFEQFDGMGNYRTQENNRPVDSSGDVAIGSDFDGPYASSTELASALSESQDVAECFARQVFRAGAGEAEGISQSETAFIQSWGNLEASDQKSLISILIALAGSDIMTYRSEP